MPSRNHTCHVTLEIVFVSLLSHFWLIQLSPIPALSTISRPVSSCSVQSHQRQPMSAVALATCEVHVSAADSQTVPTVATGVSKPLCCRLTLTFTLTIDNLSLYITLLLYWSLYNYAAHAADILTPTTVVQGVDNHSWGLYCRRCHCICVCWGCSSWIFHFSRWLGQLSSPNQGQATGLDARASRVKWPAQFMSHWYGILFIEWLW